MSLEPPTGQAESAVPYASPLKPWTGRHAVSAGLFEIRPRFLPADVRPVLDDDLDCIIGYYRRFGARAHLFDLDANACWVWEETQPLPPPEKRDPVLVVGGLWVENARGVTALGLTGTGAPLSAPVIASLRSRFAALARSPLLYSEAALARMEDPQRFLPVHILRLAMSHGERAAPPLAQPDARRYLARMLVRRQPFMVNLVTAHEDTTILDFEYWRYADTMPAAAWRTSTA